VWWSLLPVGAVAYLWAPYRRLWPMFRDLSLMDKMKVVLWVPIIRVWGDVAKIVGYPVGILWRLRHADVPSPEHP